MINYFCQRKKASKKALGTREGGQTRKIKKKQETTKSENENRTLREHQKYILSQEGSAY